MVSGQDERRRIEHGNRKLQPIRFPPSPPYVLQTVHAMLTCPAFYFEV